MASAMDASTVTAMSLPRIYRRAALLAPVGIPLLWAGTTSAVLGRKIQRIPSTPPPLPGRLRTVQSGGEPVSFRHVEGEGSPVLLVHGWGWSGDASFYPVLNHIGGEVAALDLPGHGRSGGEFSLQTGADAVAAVIRTFERPPVVVGHSMGGAVVWEMLRQKSAEVEAVVMCATSLWWRNLRTRLLLDASPVLAANRSPWLRRMIWEEMKLNPERAEWAAWKLEGRADARARRAGARTLLGFSVTDHAPEVGARQPIMWMIPDNDRVIPAAEQRRSAELAGGQIVEVPGGHSFFRDQPHLLAEAVEALVQSSGVTSSGVGQPEAGTTGTGNSTSEASAASSAV